MVIRAVPFCLPDIRSEDEAAVIETLRSGWLTTGAQVEAFEEEISRFTGAVHTVCVASCTDALQIAIAYLGLPPGSRVGVPAWTFASTATSVLHNGLTPVLLDVEPDTLNLCPSSLEQSVATLDAAVFVHFAGRPVSRECFDIAHVAGVPVVEDAAHAFGAFYPETGLGEAVNGGRSVGACFSFYATKNLTTGEGGALVTSDASLRDFARSMRLHGLDADAWRRYLPGQSGSYDLRHIGLKANMTDLAAALGRSQLKRYEQAQVTRASLVERYRENLEECGALSLVGGDGSGSGSANHLLVVALGDGFDVPRVRAVMGSHGVQTSVHFKPLHQFRLLSELCDCSDKMLSVASRMAGRVFSLPLYSSMSPDSVDYVCEVLMNALD